MIGKRIFISSIKQDLKLLIMFWIFMHLAIWLFNSFEGFFALELLLLSLSIPIYVLLILGSAVNKKGNLKIGLPFLNSYLKDGEKFVFKPGGFNLVIRAFYFLVATYALFGNMKINELYELSHKFHFIFFLLILLGIVIKTISDRNDFLIMDSDCIAWFDNEDKAERSVQWGDIQKYTIVMDTDKRRGDSPKKIVFQTTAGEFSFDIEGLAIAQYFYIITEQLENRIGESKNIINE